MIPANPGYAASFKKTNKNMGNLLPVIAWDDEGHALVLDEDEGQLVRASRFSNFDGVTYDANHYIGAIHAPGWKIRWPKNERQPEDIVDPLIGWAIRADGTGIPLALDVDGFIEPVSSQFDPEIIRP
ncbi:hypothetical protein [Micromonospora tulbaghiae]|uniref:hypothetical protein n=1 Tax=Micromonospora tulbaghiae TaxID=479978 RepID=UPI003EBF23C3